MHMYLMFPNLYGMRLPGQELCHFPNYLLRAYHSGSGRATFNKYLLNEYADMKGIQASCLKERHFLRKESACPLLKALAPDQLEEMAELHP